MYLTRAGLNSQSAPACCRRTDIVDGDSVEQTRIRAHGGETLTMSTRAL